MLTRLRHGHRFLITALCAVFVCALVFLATFSTSYIGCQSKRDAEYSKPYQPSSGEQLVTFLICQGETLDANGELLTAIGTLAVALFTLTLWLVTNRSLQLAREEFLSSHRPKIRVRAVGFAADETDREKFAVKFTCINIGDSPCEIINVRYRFDRAEKADAPINRMNMSIVELDKAVPLRPGEPTSFTTKILRGVEIENLKPEWDIYGFVSYRDTIGIDRITGFWRRYNANRDLWRSPDHPDYNYEY